MSAPAVPMAVPRGGHGRTWDRTRTYGNPTEPIRESHKNQARTPRAAHEDPTGALREPCATPRGATRTYRKTNEGLTNENLRETKKAPRYPTRTYENPRGPAGNPAGISRGPAVTYANPAGTGFVTRFSLVSVGLSWGSRMIPVGFPQRPRGAPVVYLRGSRLALVGISYGRAAGLACSRGFPHGSRIVGAFSQVPVGFPRGSRGVPVGSLRFAFGFRAPTREPTRTHKGSTGNQQNLRETNENQT